MYSIDLASLHPKPLKPSGVVNRVDPVEQAGDIRSGNGGPIKGHEKPILQFGFNVSLQTTAYQSEDEQPTKRADTFQES
jgi:hypothetical protein